MKQAMLQCRKWQDNYNIDFRIGINISPIQLDQINFYKKLRQTLQLTGASPQNIDLEITENSAINREIRLVQMFEQIFESGCTISIDDFGTGYSCLSYLKQFKVHRLKIARQLIDGIARDESDLEIVSAITAMAKSLKLKTIAEGVEKTAQLQKLQELGCDEIQGFYYSRPIPATEFEKMYLSKS
jgi:EAL domain-containing protein (putative c-di-GMP-specific phosphodiesterase class I)